MTLWFHLTLLCNELFGCKWHGHSALVWVWYSRVCWLCLIVLILITGTAWRVLRTCLFISLELLALNLALVTNTLLSCHFEFTSFQHLFKCSVLNFTSGYQDNWPLSLIFHRKINPSFPNKELILSPWQTMLSALNRVQSGSYSFIVDKYTDKLWLCFYYLCAWNVNLLQNKSLILENKHAFEGRQI